jgi:hypothetical protein
MFFCYGRNLLLVRSYDRLANIGKFCTSHAEKKREGKEVAIINHKGMEVEASKYCICRLLYYCILVSAQGLLAIYKLFFEMGKKNSSLPSQIEGCYSMSIVVNLKYKIRKIF